MMNLALLQDGYAVTIIAPVVRVDYINALKIAQGKRADLKPFVHFISTMACESLKEYLRLVHSLNGGKF